MPRPASAPISYTTLADAVAHGDPVALHDHAREMEKDDRFEEAARGYEKAFAKGSAMSGYRLAKMHEKGKGFAVDLRQARRLTEWAAMAGNVKAMHDLAVYYAEGDAGPQSYAAAADWFAKAAAFDLVDSQYNLAVLYEYGLGLPKDPARAAYWFDVAGHTGDEVAIKRAEARYGAMPAAQASKIKLQAAAFRPEKRDAKANGYFGPRSWEDGSINPTLPALAPRPAKPAD